MGRLNTRLTLTFNFLMESYTQGRINHEVDWAKCIGPKKMKAFGGKKKMIERGPTKEKIRKKGPTKVKMKGIDHEKIFCSANIKTP